MESLKVLILVIIGILFLLGVVTGAIIVIRLTRHKKNLLEKLLYYTGIAFLCMIGIMLLPLLLNFIGDLIIIAIIVVLVIIWLKRRNN